MDFFNKVNKSLPENFIFCAVVSTQFVPMLTFTSGEHTRDPFCDLVPFEQFSKREKHPWRSVIFTKSKTLPCVFFTFFKLYKLHQIAQSVSYTKRVTLEKRLRYSDLRFCWLLELIQVVYRFKTRSPLHLVPLLTH